MILVVLGALVWWSGLFAGHGESAVDRLNQWKGWLGREDKGGRVDWGERRQHVVEAMELSWDAYERYAWGGFFLPR